MAANPFNASVPGNSFIFDIYNDGQTLRAAAVPPSQILPGGPCNYTDSMLPRCGCRRFWSRAAVGSGFRDSITAGTAEICMCSHHACFHEDVQPTGPSQLPPVSSNATVVGQENKRPRSSREPLSPVQELPWQMPTSFGASLDFNLLDIQPPLPLENNKRPAQETQMPDTYNSWGDMIQSQPAHAPTEIPSIPAQCLLSSQQHLGPSQHPPSTASSSQARYLRPFAGKGLHTLSGVPAPRSAAPPPPPTGSVDGDTTQEHDPGSRRDREATPRASAMHGRSMAKNDSSNYEKLAETVESHAERLDRLETTSFSVAGHEECQDKHDHIDMRVTELESRVEEVEKILNDNGSVVSGRRLLRNDVAADDTASVSSNNTILASNRAEVYNQIQQLQAQVSQLQAASLPTYSKPWELEVVFMPFPLKGVWIEASQFCISRRNSNGADGEWTQMPNTISRATPDPQSPKFSEWRGQSADSQWLLPRAFAAGRIVDQRLRSRGLIKTVLVRGADARSVQLAIHDAFADVLRVSSLGGPRTDYSPNSPLSEFLGLRQSWVPLRKLHKDSRLRFLTPAEMATPALWDFTFLVSSVVMKATGVHRLYITQPEAYLQDHPMGYQAFETGWTWQKLRELSRVYPDSQSSTGGDVPEADALEECWTWNDKVDEHANATTSLISLRHPQVQNLSRRSSTEPSSQQFYTGVQSPILSNGLSFVRAQSPLTPRDRKGLVSVRMGSVPPPLPPQALASPALSRRRLHHSGSNSTPYERRSSPFVSSSSSSRPSPRPPNIITTNGGISNKRRFTRSPSVDPHHHHYQNRRMNTPRYSRASMSRSPSLAPPSFFDRAGSAHPPNIYYHTPASEGQWGGNGYHSRAGSRPPVNSLLRTNGYDPDDDEDDDEDMEDDDDSQSSNGKNHDNNNNNFSSSFGFGDAQQQRQGGDDEDVDVYYDEEEEEEEEENQGQRNGWSLRQQQQQQVSIMPAGTRPEDIPWAGIEDNMSDGENVDPSHHGGGGGGGGSSFTATSSSFGSSASSFQSRPASQGVMEGTEDEEEEEEDENSSQAPSEYSSKPGPWRVIDHPPVGVVGHSEVVLVGREESHNKRRESLREMMMPPPLPTPGPGPPTSAVGNSGMMTMMGFQVYEDGTAGDDGVE
ncbi:hypothetical protein QBC38DRAFT_370405 [Podospora fimiseda]|uniref:Uncharacterized protein n=1 Tax=Podospora fimiseda TaxID=252190 RepID=A0AAN7GTW0_9PEZI|nr:hypothetical protein QBC38DRAFT_370405 [Podospora fimiseda]